MGSKGQADRPEGGSDDRAVPGARRVFLGWDGRPDGPDGPWRSLLERAAAWIAGPFADEHGPDLAHVIVATPGGRPARRLEQLVARRLASRDGVGVPARFTTVGRLVDLALSEPGAGAGRLARTLAWGAALQDCPAAALQDLLARPPGPDDVAGRHRLAGELRSSHGRLAPEGLDFAAVREVLAETPDARRWQVLAELQAAYRQRLAALGLADPHDRRREAVQAGALDERLRVVLVGAVELNALTRQALAVLGRRVDVLVFAPEDRADDFDEWGAVSVEAWAEADVALSDEHWSIEGSPGDQADATLGLVAGWQGRYSAAQITLGVPDAQVVPELEGRLPNYGVATRSAAGQPLRATAPWRLLEAVAAWRASGRFAELASLVRHPDVHGTLRARLGCDPAEACDAYGAAHLPGAIPASWCTGDRPEEAALAATLTALQTALAEWFAPLPAGDQPVSLRATAEGALQVLRHLYGGRTLDVQGAAADRRLGGALAALRDALLEVSEGPAALVDEDGADGPTALGLILGDCAGRSVPPAPDEGALELLGWLELPLDDAPALIMTGFNGGRVPAAPAGDAFLSDAYGRLLGLPEERARRARDVYLMNLLVHSRDTLRLISGRRTREGDPLRPSRLVFHRPDDEVPDRVERFVQGGRLRRVRDEGGEARRIDGTRSDGGANERSTRPLRAPQPLRSISVTAFRDHLASPYLYALRHVGERLESVDDSARELDGSLFGILGHEVLASLDGQVKASRSTDPDEIARFLLARLRARVREQFGEAALPAVAVQVEQLASRLRHFAEWQARRAAGGWEILAVEWAPGPAAWEGWGSAPDGKSKGSVPFEVDGEVVALRGRIDRIDLRPATGEWALLDYKTADAGKSPQQVHGPRRVTERWDDLQLPLYRLLCRPLPDAWTQRGLDAEREPVLGFVNLSRDVKSDAGALLSTARWDAAQLADAEAQARRVVREIRAGDFPLGRFPEHDPILAAVAGVGLLDGGGDDDEDDGAEGGP